MWRGGGTQGGGWDVAMLPKGLNLGEKPKGDESGFNKSETRIKRKNQWKRSGGHKLARYFETEPQV